MLDKLSGLLGTVSRFAGGMGYGSAGSIWGRLGATNYLKNNWLGLGAVGAGYLTLRNSNRNRQRRGLGFGNGLGMAAGAGMMFFGARGAGLRNIVNPNLYLNASKRMRIGRAGRGVYSSNYQDMMRISRTGLSVAGYSLQAGHHMIGRARSWGKSVFSRQ